MSREGYMEFKISSGKAWVLSSRIRDLQRIDAIFFDCDGALIDVRESYNATIVETVKFLAKSLLGLDVLSFIPLRRAILELKRSGGFNNDWVVSYALLLGIYTYLPREEGGTVSPNTSSTNRGGILSEGIQPPISETSWQRVGEALMNLARRADSTGLISLEKALTEDGHGQLLSEAKKLLGYPVEASIVSRVFDEIFYGPQLFRQKFKIEPKFYVGRGFVERDTLAVSREVLSRLAARVGRERIGIISGRDWDSAKKTLGELLNDFESKNLLFLMVDPSHGAVEARNSEPILNKPNPEILLKAVEMLGRFQCCLYVGDSAEDLMMVQRANKGLPRFAFAGVYDLVDFKDEVCSQFLEMGAEMVLPSVNNLPELLDTLGGWKG
jgi:phosphoglycolate phosphatase-like HAD superfamily hydrolase